MNIECFSTLDEHQAQEWRDFSRAAAHQHMRQDIRFAEAERSKGKDPIFVIGRDETGSMQAVAWFSRSRSPLSSGSFSVATSPSGPICDDLKIMREFLECIPSHPEFRKVGCIQVTPYWIGADALRAEDILMGSRWHPVSKGEPRRTGIIDISRSESEISASFSESSRYSLRLFKRLGAEIRIVNSPSDAREFFDRLHRNVIQKIGGSPIHPAEHSLAIIDDPEDSIGAKIFGAFFDNKLLGGILVYRSARSAHAARYFADVDACNMVAKNLRIAPSLWLAGMLWAKSNGCHYFDVEGFEHTTDRNHPKFGVYEYKRQMGAIETERFRDHLCIVNRRVYALTWLIDRVRKLRRHLPGLADRLKRLRG